MAIIMSFSSDVKNELCKIKASTCCKLAECYGILLFGRTFSVKSISITTENEDIIDRFAMLLKQYFSVSVKVVGSGTRREMFTAFVDSEQDRTAIINALGHGGTTHSRHVIKWQNLEDDCCKGAFIRGAFLACGTICDPNREYHAEFLIQGEKLANEFCEVLRECNLSPKVSIRGKSTVVYFKESENIEDLLTTINATTHTLELAGIKVYKDMRNHFNRLNNCETANISKTVNAAVTQKMAIDELRRNGQFDKLSDELKMAAVLREENPEASLSELCQLSGGTLTRSGLNHRFNRLVELSKEQKG